MDELRERKILAPALASIINAQHRHPFAAHWGDGTTSSSDAQRFPVGGRGASIGHINDDHQADHARGTY